MAPMTLICILFLALACSGPLLASGVAARTPQSALLTSVGSEVRSCAEYIASGRTVAECLANAADVCLIHWKPLIVAASLIVPRRDAGADYLRKARETNDRKWPSKAAPPYRR